MIFKQHLKIFQYLQTTLQLSLRLTFFFLGGGAGRKQPHSLLQCCKNGFQASRQCLLLVNILSWTPPPTFHSSFPTIYPSSHQQYGLLSPLSRVQQHFQFEVPKSILPTSNMVRLVTTINLSRTLTSVLVTVLLLFRDTTKATHFFYFYFQFIYTSLIKRNI